MINNVCLITADRTISSADFNSQFGLYGTLAKRFGHNYYFLYLDQSGELSLSATETGNLDNYTHTKNIVETLNERR